MPGHVVPASDPFVHTALIVDSDDTVRTRLIPYLRRSLDAQERVLLVVGGQVERLVRASLGALADRLEWGGHDTFGVRLGLAYEGLRRYLAAQHASGNPVHVITEPDVVTDAHPGSPDRAAAHLSYESACADAYAGYDCPVTCLWDSRRHPTLVIEGVRSLHSHELTETGRVPNAAFLATTDYLAVRAEVPLEPTPPVVELDVGLTSLDELAPLRGVLRAWAHERSFDVEAIGDLVVAVTEVATNALVHGALPVRLRCWSHRDTLIAQVDDAGGRRIPPAAGYRHPDRAGKAGGRGLWLARQLADVVTTHTDRSRTSVRLYFPPATTHRGPTA
ncbi:ATP-binding protein [Micromonospora sp. CPCC 205711]|uniref:ATP-binding protein n=1 Tax=Micromonospora sp. CPCC 205547 TaxID=3122400 RepID=UPI002FEED7E8